jgi:hypothetical protein
VSLIRNESLNHNPASVITQSRIARPQPRVGFLQIKLRNNGDEIAFMYCRYQWLCPYLYLYPRAISSQFFKSLSFCLSLSPSDTSHLESEVIMWVINITKFNRNYVTNTGTVQSVENGSWIHFLWGAVCKMSSWLARLCQVPSSNFVKSVGYQDQKIFHALISYYLTKL